MPKTGFDPTARGFPFVNSWQLDQADAGAVLEILDDAAGSALAALKPLFGSILTAAESVLKSRWPAGNSDLQTYGLCGGMAFAALDYYTAGLAIPTAKVVPTRANTAGTVMRNFLQRRQLDSLRDNLVTVLVWMTVLNYIPQWWSFKSGAPWLLDRSKEEWNRLKNKINAGQPSPLGLIGTTKDPMQNHQVLAYGYDEPDPTLGTGGTGIIYVYDMNCPGVQPTPDCPGGERTIRLDFRGRVLSAQECCPNPLRGPLRGLICEKYSAVRPPLVEDWTATV
jgi:hypothetical protein